MLEGTYQQGPGTGGSGDIPLYPERVLNLCSARKLAFWGSGMGGGGDLYLPQDRGGSLHPQPRERKKLDCTIEIVRREGAHKLAQLRHRQALAVRHRGVLERRC